MNAIVFGERWGRGQKVVAYPDVFFTMLNLFSSFTDDNMMPQAITLHDEFIIILSQYIAFINACHTLHHVHIVARIPRYS